MKSLHIVAYPSIYEGNPPVIFHHSIAVIVLLIQQFLLLHLHFDMYRAFNGGENKKKMKVYVISQIETCDQGLNEK